MTELSKERQAVRDEVARRGLASFMNATKWFGLRDAVLNDMPFPPMFEMQPVLGPRIAPYPPGLMNHHGDWEAGLEPFWAVEWIQVRPRFAHHRGALIAPRVEDASEQFRAILRRLNIPFAERDGDFWVYGYAERAPC